jgi:hypothetical protein
LEKEARVMKNSKRKKLSRAILHLIGILNFYRGVLPFGGKYYFHDF